MHKSVQSKLKRALHSHKRALYTYTHSIQTLCVHTAELYMRLQLCMRSMYSHSIGNGVTPAQKSPTLTQKSPIYIHTLHTNTLCVRSRAAYALYVFTLYRERRHTRTKEPYLHSKEPYTHTIEPCIHTHTPYIHAVFTQKGCLYSHCTGNSVTRMPGRCNVSDRQNV